MIYLIPSFSCNMIFMILVKRSFHALPRRFIGLNNASAFCLSILFNATGFPELPTLNCARRCGWHQNYQLSTRILHDIFEFSIIRINEVNTAQFPGTVEPRFLDSPLLLFFACRRIGHIFPKSLAILEVVCVLVSLLPDHVYPSGGFSLNTANLAKPVHLADNSRSPSTFQ